MFKQVIIARKDLNMSPGKLAAQASHASIAFLIEKLYWGSKEVVRERDGLMYHIGIAIDRSLFHNQIAEAETKVVCRAKNKNDLLREGDIFLVIGASEYTTISNALRVLAKSCGAIVVEIQDHASVKVREFLENYERD